MKGFHLSLFPGLHSYLVYWLHMGNMYNIIVSKLLQRAEGKDVCGSDQSSNDKFVSNLCSTSLRSVLAFKVTVHLQGYLQFNR